MRAVTLTLVACMLLAASVAAVDSQASARAVETRWKNCSQISRGRLGALHDADDNTVNAELSQLSWKNLTAGYNYGIKFQPCVTPFVTITDSSFGKAQTVTTFDQVYPAGGVQPITTFPTDTRLVTFTMPDTSDAVPMITISYRSAGAVTLDVTAKCDPSTTGNVTAFNNTLPNRWTLTVNTVEACARFPYTNQALPGGGVAALVVCILCFVFEFAACFVYHKNNKNHSPLDEESMR